jgi:hypothetical protein
MRNDNFSARRGKRFHYLHGRRGAYPVAINYRGNVGSTANAQEETILGEARERLIYSRSRPHMQELSWRQYSPLGEGAGVAKDKFRKSHGFSWSERIVSDFLTLRASAAIRGRAGR